MSNLNTRINLLVDMPTSIQIEKEAEKKGVSRTQFIKESIKEKLNKKDSLKLGEDLELMRSDIKELKLLTVSILEKVREVN